MRRLESSGIDLDLTRLKYTVQLLIEPPSPEDERLWCIEHFPGKMYDFVTNDDELVSRISSFYTSVREAHGRQQSSGSASCNTSCSDNTSSRSSQFSTSRGCATPHGSHGTRTGRGSMGSGGGSSSGACGYGGGGGSTGNGAPLSTTSKGDDEHAKQMCSLECVEEPLLPCLDQLSLVDDAQQQPARIRSAAPERSPSPWHSRHSTGDGVLLDGSPTL